MQDVVGVRGFDPEKFRRQQSITTPPASMSSSKDPDPDPSTAQKRQVFAQRRDSTIGMLMMIEPVEDNEMRRRFRNYEI